MRGAIRDGSEGPFTDRVARPAGLGEIGETARREALREPSHGKSGTPGNGHPDPHDVRGDAGAAGVAADGGGGGVFGVLPRDLADLPSPNVFHPGIVRRERARTWIPALSLACRQPVAARS